MHRLQIALAGCVFAVMLCTGEPTASAHDEGSGTPTPGPSSVLSDIPCVDGFADVFPCSNVDLLAYMPLNTIGGGSGNDIWGWTDPLTGTEYAIMGRSTGTSFIDVSDPRRPTYVGNLPSHTTDSFLRDVKTYRNHAFIVSEAPGHGMQVFDLTQLRTVQAPPTNFSSAAHYAGFGNAHNVVINEDSGFAYAVGSSTCAGGLHMIDIEDPLNPAFAGCFLADGYTHDAQCVFYDGPDSEHTGKEICFNANEDTLTVVDVTDKTAPRQLSRTGYAGAAYAHQGWLTEDHAYLLMNDELDEIDYAHGTRTYVWNLADLDAPTMIGHHTAASPAVDHNLYIRDGHVFEANYRSGLRILRLDDVTRASLREVAFFDIYPADDLPNFSATWSNYPFFASGIVIVSGVEQGLFIVQPHLGGSPPTATPERTPTASPTPTAAPAFQVTGRILYHGSNFPVSGVTVQAYGPVARTAQTDDAGWFALAGLGPDTWEIEPVKLGAVGTAIGALDAVHVLQSVVGLRTLDRAQQVACDVTGNGTLSGLDASLILQHKVGLISTFPAAQLCASEWAFVPDPDAAPNQETTEPVLSPGSCAPGAIAFQPLTNHADGQDFSAVLFGDCTGNWVPDGGGAGAALTAVVAPQSAVRMGRPRHARRGRIRVPVAVETTQPFHALEMQLRYDPVHLRARGVRRLSSARTAMVRVNTNVPGLITIALASARPLAATHRPLFALQFEGRGRVAAVALRRALRVVIDERDTH